MRAADTAAAKHSNHSLVNQAIAAMYKHPQLHEHVVGWAPMRSGQLNAEVHLSFKDTSAQHRQQLASGGAIQVTLAGAATPVSLPVSTVAAKQLPDVTLVRLHNIPCLPFLPSVGLSPPILHRLAHRLLHASPSSAARASAEQHLVLLRKPFRQFGRSFKTRCLRRF